MCIRDSCYFVDLPGYGYAKVSNADRERWDDLINSYFEAPRHHTLLVQLIDCRHAPSADDLQMLKYLHYHQIPVSYTHLLAQDTGDGTLQGADTGLTGVAVNDAVERALGAVSYTHLSPR